MARAPSVQTLKTTIATSGSSPGGPLVRKASPKPSQIAQSGSRRPPSPKRCATNPATARVSNRVSSVSVVMMLAATNGKSEVACTTAASSSRPGASRRARRPTSSTIATKASAFGSRAAHSLRPNSPIDVASAQ